MENKEYLKTKLEDYLNTYMGINTRKNFNCLNPNHIDNNPSMGLDKQHNQVHCFACGVKYDIFDLIGMQEGLTSFKEQYAKACTLYNVTRTPVQVYKRKNKAEGVSLIEYFSRCHSNVNKTDYLTNRGYSKEIIDKFNLGYDEQFFSNGEIWKAIIIPTSDDTYVARNTDTKAIKKNRYRKYGESQLFNTSVLNSDNDIIIICEGELDALSIEQLGKQALGLGSLNNMGKLLSLLDNKLYQNKRFIVALDNDINGQKTSKKLVESLQKLQYKCCEYNLYGDFKDANEIMLANSPLFSKLLNEAVEKVTSLKDEKEQEHFQAQMFNYIGTFKQEMQDITKNNCIPTGFSHLDKSLIGGLYSGLYVIGALSAFGKTSFVMQMVDQIAKQGTDVLIFSLEMSKKELMAKTISRITYELNNKTKTSKGIIGKSAIGLLNSNIYSKYSKADKNLIDKAINMYATYAKNIYIYEGIGNINVNDIKDTVEAHIRYTGKNPLVVIDYLQILSSIDIRMSDKQSIDKSVVELKRIGREYNIPIIAISSLNRASYTSFISMEAFKESGSIEYSSDVLLGLQLKGMGVKNFNIKESLNKCPRLMELVILKNRNGRSGITIDYNYFPKYNFFEEVISENTIVKRV